MRFSFYFSKAYNFYSQCINFLPSSNYLGSVLCCQNFHEADVKDFHFLLSRFPLFKL